ncbi:uncharacterized protein LOC133198134 [Saccostrea echinata]|uniref:uncharacterized protein LOC133198134 n=1 Tax=Saccostrea echinata TaxID=191078 RepID=UPI002A7F3F13|nr:uncharacterized protein LOC133198134 [Saccostrea echinata]
MIISVVIVLILSDLGQTVNPFCYPGDSCFPGISIIHTFASSLPNGSVVFPSDNKTYTDVTLMHNLIRTRYPFAVVMAMSRDDVKDTIAFARQYNLRVTVLGTGHDFNGRSTGNGTLQLNLSLMKSREVDLDSWRHENGTISVGPGNLWIDVYREVDKYGRVVVGGSAHTVGMGGYTLGGGHSPICRFYGMAIDNLLEVEMVMADGRVVTATKDYVHTIYNNGSTSNVSDSEFFWAIAGGGGGTFGVSTRLLFKLHMPPEKVFKLVIIYPMNTVYGEDVFEQVTGKIKELFTNDLPNEWGGYLIFDGNTDEYLSKGHVTFVLNHLGSNTTASYKYLQSLIEFLPNKRYFSATEYQTFLEYEETITDAQYYLTFVYNSLIPSSNLTEEFRDYIRQTVFIKPTPNSGTGYTATLIGGKMHEITPEATSVHPGFRNTLLSMTGGVGFGLPGIPEIEKIFYKTVERNIEFAKFGYGMYPNEAAQATPNWQTNFWGTNYDRLYRIKLREDPDDFFTCDQCVGSELRNQSELKTTTSSPSSVTSAFFSTATSSSSSSQPSSFSDDSSTPLSSTTLKEFQTTLFSSTLNNPISHASTTSKLSVLNLLCNVLVLCAYLH